MNVEKLEKIILRYINLLNFDKPDLFYGVSVDIIPPYEANSIYIIFINFLYKEPWNQYQENTKITEYKREIMNFLKNFIVDKTSLENNYNVYFASRTLKDYLENKKPIYDQQKKYSSNKKITEILKKINNNFLTEASKKNILINKIGLSEENAELMDRLCGPLSVWMTNKVIDKQLYALKNWKNVFEFTKQDSIEKLNSGNLGYFTRKINGIMDWIRIGLNGNLGEENKKLSFDELDNKSKQWHDSLGVNEGDINYIEKNPIILDFRDGKEGFYWVNLETNASDEECKRMGHCGRTGYDNILYSLREVKKLSGDKFFLNKSHLTASIGLNGTLYQLKGPKNSKPKKEYYNYILPLFYYKKDNNRYLIDKIGSEYASNLDFKIEDFDPKIIQKLYNDRPKLFETRTLQKLLIKLNIINKPKLDYKINVTLPFDKIGDIIKGDYVVSKGKRKRADGSVYTYKTTLFETIMDGEAWDLWDNPNPDWEFAIDYYLDENNENKIREYLKRNAEKIDPDLDLDSFNESSLSEIIKTYDDDYEIRNAIKNTIESCEKSLYGDYLYDVLIETIKEIGEIEKITNMLTIKVDLEKYLELIDDNDIEEMMTKFSDDLECVFFEVLEYFADRPEFSVDQYWEPDIEDYFFNDVLKDYLP